jgi:soluble lytic murein transglycosylase-like protein/uncharacterized protein YcbK (DUF882 family)
VAPAGLGSTVGVVSEGGVPLDVPIARRLLFVCLVAAGLGLLAAGAADAQGGRQTAALRARASVASALAASAALGLDRGLFVSSPGGASVTAAHVARWRPLVRRAARHSGFGPNLLEALVFVESSGRPDAIAGGGVASSAGLTQIGARTAKRLLHMHVNMRRSGALTHRIERADARGAHRTARQLRRWRARYDARFAPAKSLRAAVRYLVLARRYLGRADLAVAAYHLGIRNVQRLVRSYGGEAPSYAELYFGSAPDRHARTWRRLASFGETSRDYYWKVLAAKRIMRLYRRDPAALRFESRQQARKNSAEEFMHPRFRTAQFARPRSLASAWRHRVLRAIPLDTARTHIKVSRFLGQEARALGRSRRLYRGLRAPALDALLYIGRRVHRLSGTRAPLLVTSAVRDNRYQRVLMRTNANAARTYSTHTTGYAFDVARTYRTARQAAAFEFVLERLEAVNAIAFIRESAAIHIAVAADFERKLALLARA